MKLRQYKFAFRVILILRHLTCADQVFLKFEQYHTKAPKFSWLSLDLDSTSFRTNVILKFGRTKLITSLYPKNSSNLGNKKGEINKNANAYFVEFAIAINLHPGSECRLCSQSHNAHGQLTQT
jgi:hypothetical protein